MSTADSTALDEHDAWVNRYNNESAIRAVAQGLLDATWPEPDWKHREHCIATLGLILFYPEMDLDQELPGIIQRYNVANGGQNTDTSGYHHTMTLLFLNAIRHFVRTLPPGTSPGDAARALLQSPIGTKEYPLRYYSRECIMSKEARRGWVVPDLAQPVYPIGKVV
jgi:hypothetical protein